MATQSRLLNTGQSCISAKRFIVVKDITDKFIKLFVENTQAEVVGDTMDSKTTVGPLVRESQRQALSIQAEDAKSKGANIPLILTIIFTIVQYLETPKRSASVSYDTGIWPFTMIK